jgi:hypothetical protein
MKKEDGLRPFRTILSRPEKLEKRLVQFRVASAWGRSVGC